MIDALGGLIGTLTATFVVPFAGAMTPLSLPLPQDIDYVSYMSSQLQSAPFSTDPAAVQAAEPGQATLQIFSRANEICHAPGQPLSVSVVVQNSGTAAASTVAVQLQLPAHARLLSANPRPDHTVDARQLLVWSTPSLAPQHSFTLSLLFEPSEATPLQIPITALANEGNLLTLTEVGSNACTASSVPLWQRVLGITDAQPPVICPKIAAGPDAGKDVPGCTSTQAASARPGKPAPLPAYANPQLGVRYQEAIGDILPGECSVTADDIIIQPDFHDALNRRASVADYFIKPLYDSGQEYRQLAHANVLLGIGQMAKVYEHYQKAHGQNWREYQDLLSEALRVETDARKEFLQIKSDAEAARRRGELSEQALTQRLDDAAKARNQKVQQAGEQALKQFDQYVKDGNCQGGAGGWIARVACHAEELTKPYACMQEERAVKFKPVGDRAVHNADVSIVRACRDPRAPTEDLALKQALYGLQEPQGKFTLEQCSGKTVRLTGGVQKQYEDTLTDRDTRYSQAYAAAAKTYTELLQRDWRPALAQAVARAGNGDEAALSLHQQLLAEKDRQVFDAVVKPFEDHDAEDERVDKEVRVQRFEVALDTPKTTATNCEKEYAFNDPVESTWCESGSYPASIVRGAPQPARKNVAPHIIDSPNGGSSAGASAGTVCGGGPGDPYWTLNCGCRCGELMPCGLLLVPCQLYYPLCTGDPDWRLLHHDINVTSQAECLNEPDDHIDIESRQGNPPSAPVPAAPVPSPT